MAFVPVSYNARSLFRRRASTALTVASIGATVAVFAGVLALQQGFAALFTESGRDDLAVLLRLGANSEGVSAFDRERAQALLKGTPEIAEADGRPLATAESYLAVRRRKLDGGETNVPIRGVQPTTFDLRAASFEILQGRNFQPGTDEVIVGRGLVDRILGCNVGDVLQFNVTPFEVVGVFDCEGPFPSEIWGDVDRMMSALERPFYNRILAQMKPGVDLAAMTERMAVDRIAPAKVLSEREYMSSQTRALSATLLTLGTFLALVMGAAAIFTGTNTMLAAVASRTQEIGILLSMGFRPFAIFFSFLLEALLLGLVGGIVGCFMVLPLNGVRTGTTNFDTFTEVAFAFRVTPTVLVTAVTFALILGVIGGAGPAWRAAHLRPTEALRRV